MSLISQATNEIMSDLIEQHCYLLFQVIKKIETLSSNVEDMNWIKYYNYLKEINNLSNNAISKTGGIIEFIERRKQNV